MNKLIVTQYTDPMCIWCYGLEPALRKLEFHNVMGLLVCDHEAGTCHAQLGEAV